MIHTKPITGKIVQNDFTTGMIRGGSGNDHLIHHRDLSVEGNAGTGMATFAGDDILEGSVPNGGQLHMFSGTGDDWFILDVTKIAGAHGMQGHHAYGGHGRDTFQFTNIAQNLSPITGRLDDFDPTSDRILIEGTEIDLTDLPRTIRLPGGEQVTVRVIEIEHPEYSGENLGAQHFLAIGDNIFYALEGARDLQNGTSGLTGEERHFLKPDALETLRAAETVQYENPKNFVPREFYEHREDVLNLNWSPTGATVTAETGGKDAVHMYGGKGNPHAHSSSGAQDMRGGDGDDVIDGNSGNDTITGGKGNDLIAGGIDNDRLHGGPGDDMIWGGDGNDSLFGGPGNDYLHGGRGNDRLEGREGNDTLVGGRGNDTLIGGGGPDDVNRFHFAEGDGHDLIINFKVGSDKITLQHEINPLSVELYENKAGNTVLNYGKDASVELRGVKLQDFQKAAELRAEEDDPIISVTTDPEEELLQALRGGTGPMGATESASAMVDGILYGNTPFWDDGPGGYTYVSEHSEEDEMCCEDEGHLEMHDTTYDDTHDDTHDHILDEMHPGMPRDDGLLPETERPFEDDEKLLDNEHDKNDVEGANGTCFVATAAYRDPWHPDVVFLRAFRDQWLAHHAFGRAFIAFYWRVGPVMAGPVRRSPRLARPARALISGIVCVLRKLWS